MTLLVFTKQEIYKLFKRIILIGDSDGIKNILSAGIDQNLIIGIIGASIRSQYFDELKLIAKQLNRPLFIQPKYSCKEYLKFSQSIQKIKPDLMICNSYSMLIQNDLLDLVKGNAINIHYSLLPKNRGCNPTQWAIIKGEKETGVSLHYMGMDFDNGDIIDQRSIPINEKDSWFDINQRLHKLSVELLKSNLDAIINLSNNRISQNESEATYNYRLSPSSIKILFESMSDTDIYNIIRAQVAPLKGAYIEHQGKKIRFLEMLSFEEIKRLRIKYVESTQ